MKEYLPSDIKNQLVIYNEVVSTNGLHFAVRKDHPRARELIAQFDEAVNDMIADGSYNKVLGFDWVKADSNSDGVVEYIAADTVHNRTENPTLSGSAYTLFSRSQGGRTTETARYRVGNREYDSWEAASSAISAAERPVGSPQETSPGTFDFLIKSF
jgi:hypothetical protein